MNTVTVVDARMGRGKSSAAIRYMNRYKGTKKFLYITPYLNTPYPKFKRWDYKYDQSSAVEAYQNQNAVKKNNFIMYKLGYL